MIDKSRKLTTFHLPSRHHLAHDNSRQKRNRGCFSTINQSINRSKGYHFEGLNRKIKRENSVDLFARKKSLRCVSVHDCFVITFVTAWCSALLNEEVKVVFFTVKEASWFWSRPAPTFAVAAYSLLYVRSLNSASPAARAASYSGSARFCFARAADFKRETAKPRGNCFYFTTVWKEKSFWSKQLNMKQNLQEINGNKRSYRAYTIVLHFASNGEPWFLHYFEVPLSIWVFWDFFPQF